MHLEKSSFLKKGGKDAPRERREHTLGLAAPPPACDKKEARNGLRVILYP
jgi:hypothetical protein